MVHIHHSQPLRIKFGTNHFLGSETFGPIQYREGVNTICKHNYIEQEELGLFCLKPKNRFLKNTWTLYARAELQINFTHDKKKVNAIDKMFFFFEKN